MAKDIPTPAQLIKDLVLHGYTVQILESRKKYIVLVQKKEEKAMGVSMPTFNTRMLTAALIKLKKKIEAY